MSTDKQEEEASSSKSAFAFVLQGGRQSPGPVSLPVEQPQQEEEPTASAFSFLMNSKSASPPPPPEPEPDFLGMGGKATSSSSVSSTKGSYSSSDLQDLLSLDAPVPLVTTTSTTIPPAVTIGTSLPPRSSSSSGFSPDHARRSHTFRSGGGSSGDLMAGLNLRSSSTSGATLAAPSSSAATTTAPTTMPMGAGVGASHLPTGSITFERTAMARSNIRKKRQQVKVGYAREESIEAVGASAPIPHPQAHKIQAHQPHPHTPTRPTLAASPPLSVTATASTDHYRLPTASSSSAASNRGGARPQPTSPHHPPGGTVIVSADNLPATRALQARHGYHSPAPKPKVSSPPLASPGIPRKQSSGDKPPQPLPADASAGFGGFISRFFGGGGPKKEPEKPATPQQPQPVPLPKAPIHKEQQPPPHAKLQVRRSPDGMPSPNKDVGGRGLEPRRTPAQSSSNSVEEAGNFTDDTSQSSASPRPDDKDLDQEDGYQKSSHAPRDNGTATPVPVEEFKPQPPSAPPPHRKLPQEGGLPASSLPPSTSSASAKLKRSPPSPRITSPSASSPPLASAQPAPTVDEVETNRTTLESLVKDFQRDATHLCFRQQDVRRRLAKVAQDRSELQKEQASFNEELKRYEAEQQRLAEKEEFDKADALSQVIEQVKEQASERLKSLQAMTVETGQLEKSLADSHVEQVKAMQSVVERLRGFLKARVVELDQYSDQARMSHETERKRLVAEEKRISMEISHIQKEESAMKEETVSVEASIEAQTSDLMVRKEELEGKVSGVEEEIAKLEAALQAKKQERARLVQELGGAESEIQKIRSKFERQLQRLKEKERTLDKSRAECETEQASLSRQKVVHEDACASVKSEEARRKALVQQAKDELNAATELTASFLSQEQFQKDLELDVSQASIKERQELQDQVTEAEQKAGKLRKEYNRLHTKMNSLREEVESIDVRIPLLEHAKKDAAASKNYKEAGAKSKEIKSLQVRREEAEAELSQAKGTISSMQSSVEEMEATLSERRSALHSLEKEMEGRKAGILAKRARELRRSKRALDKLHVARLHTSAEILMQAELEAVALEIETLKNRFGIEVDLGGDEEAEEQQAPPSEPPAPPREEVKEVEVESQVADKEGEGGEPGEVEETSPEERRPPSPREPPGPEAIANAKDLHLQIISLEDKLSTAVEQEDFEAADEINTCIERLRGQIAELGIDVVNLILADGSDDDSGDDGLEKAGIEEEGVEAAANPPASAEEGDPLNSKPPLPEDKGQAGEEEVE